MGNQAPPVAPVPTPAATPAASTGPGPVATPAKIEPPPSPTAPIAIATPPPENKILAQAPWDGADAGPSKPFALATPANASDPSTDIAGTRPHSMVEIMALSHESDAEAMVAALNRHGYRVAVRHESQDALLHLDVGPFANEKDAETIQQRLIADGYNATIK